MIEGAQIDIMSSLAGMCGLELSSRLISMEQVAACSPSDFHFNLTPAHPDASHR